MKKLTYKEMDQAMETLMDQNSIESEWVEKVEEIFANAPKMYHSRGAYGKIWETATMAMAAIQENGCGLGNFNDAIGYEYEIDSNGNFYPVMVEVNGEWEFVER